MKQHLQTWRTPSPLMRCLDTMTVQSHSSFRLVFCREDSGLHCWKPMAPSHSPISRWLKQKDATPTLNAKCWASCLDLSDSTNTSMDGTWKCIWTINRLRPSTPNIYSLPHLGWRVCYSAYNSTTWASITGSDAKLADALSRVNLCNTGPIRGLDLSVLEVHVHLNASPARIVEIRMETSKDSTLHALCEIIIWYCHSAGQITERIARRTWCSSGNFETNWMWKTDWYWRDNALSWQSPYMPQH